MSRTLFVGNLSSETRRSDLEEICGAYGDVRRVSIPKDPDTGGGRGFAFVEYSSSGAAETALHELQGVELGGRALRVSPAKDKRAGKSRAPRFRELDDDGFEEAASRASHSRRDRDEERSKGKGSWRDERHRRQRRGRADGSRDRGDRYR